MYGDYSRWTFDPDNNHAAVLVQQGQPLTDADWNEQAMIAAESQRAVVHDFFGDLVCFKDGKPASPDIAAKQITIVGPYIYIKGVRVSTSPLSLDKKNLLEIDASNKFLGQELSAPPYQLYLEADPVVADRFSGFAADSALQAAEPLRLKYQVRVGLMPAAKWKDFSERGNTDKLPTLTIQSKSALMALYRIEVLKVAGDDGPIQFVWTKTNAKTLLRLKDPKDDIAEGTSVLTIHRDAQPLLKAIRRGQYVTTMATDLLLSDQTGQAAYQIDSVDADRGQIILKTPVPKGVKVNHVRVWDGWTELKFEAAPNQTLSLTILADNGVSAAFTDLASLKNSKNLQPGDHWSFITRPPAQTIASQFSLRSPYFVVLAKINAGPVLAQLEFAKQSTMLSSVAEPAAGTRTVHSQVAAQLPQHAAFPSMPSPAVAIDLTLRHLAASIKTPQLKQWLHSATLPEVWGLGLTRLRDKLLSCFPKPPADNALFEEDLRRVIQDSDIIAQRLDYRGTENDSQFA